MENSDNLPSIMRTNFMKIDEDNDLDVSAGLEGHDSSFLNDSDISCNLEKKNDEEEEKLKNIKLETEEEEKQDWKRIENYARNLEKKFKSESGPKLPENFQVTPLNIFRLFFSDEIFQMIVEQSNLYAEQCKVENSEHLKEHPRARLNAWVPTNTEEIERFIGLILTMGIHSNSEIKDNWSLDPLLATKYSKYMRRDRFHLLLRYLHLSDNTLVDHSRLRKVNKFCQTLIKNFSKYFTPGENIAIDEGMIPFKGRLFFKQYNPMKPVKWGIKLFLLANSPDGYVTNAIIYDGKNEEINYSASSVVLKLSEPYYHSNRHIFTDRYYTSLNLISELEKLGLYFTGTINTNRKGLPKFSNLKKNELVYYKSDSKILMNWRPRNKFVTLITNYYDIASFSKTFYHRRIKQTVVLEKPKIVFYYNKLSKSVDLNNSFCRYYRFNHKNYRWWRAIFFYFIELCVSNTYVIMTYFTQKTSLKKIRMSIAKSLLGEVEGLNDYHVVNSKSKYHLPDYIVKKTTEEDGKKKCIICREKTKYRCTKCSLIENEIISLCIPKCFQRHHLYNY